MAERYLTPSEADLFVRDLRDGPAMVFCQAATLHLLGDVTDDRLSAAVDRTLTEMPVLSQRVYRADGWWRYGRAHSQPVLYREHHQIDGGCDAALRRLELERRRPIDPVAGPLGRVSVLRFASECAFLVIMVHDLVGPGCAPARWAGSLTEASGRTRVLEPAITG
jgi:hypothetical protein